jgi:hypothetical protein
VSGGPLATGHRTTIRPTNTSRVQPDTDPKQRIRGIVVVNLEDIDRYDYDAIRIRLSAINRVPAGCIVHIRAGDIMPTSMMLDGVEYGHVAIYVLSEDPGPWVRFLRDEPEPDSGVWSSGIPDRYGWVS